MIVTERLYLRDFEEDDLADVNAYTSDIEVVREFPFGPSTIEETRSFIAQVRSLPKAEPRTIYDLAIALKETNRAIGGCYLKVEGTPEPTGFIVYLLNRQYWGQGYATETARALRVCICRPRRAPGVHLLRRGQPGLSPRAGKGGDAARRTDPGKRLVSGCMARSVSVCHPAP